MRMREKLPCYMMATKATHQLGDISRDDEDYCYVQDVTEDGYKGAWCEGFGFVNVTFPFETTRPLTADEQARLDKMRLVIA